MSSLPTPGERWQTPDGVHWTVKNVTGAFIGLLSDKGPYQRVYANQWPGSWMLVPGESEGEKDPPIRALLVGGDTGESFLRIRDLAVELNVLIDDHVDGRKSPTRMQIRTGIDLVVILTSHMSHGLYQNAKKQAASSGIPVVHAKYNGFKEDLRNELTRVNPALRTRLTKSERMGAVLSRRNEPWWSWDDHGEVWELMTVEDFAPPSADVSGGDMDGVVSGALVLGVLGILARTA